MALGDHGAAQDGLGLGGWTEAEKQRMNQGKTRRLRTGEAPKKGWWGM